jgi:hypothetical protein
MTKFRIEAFVEIDPERLKNVGDPARWVRDDADAALHTFADAVGGLYVSKIWDEKPARYALPPLEDDQTAEMLGLVARAKRENEERWGVKDDA